MYSSVLVLALGNSPRSSVRSSLVKFIVLNITFTILHTKARIPGTLRQFRFHERPDKTARGKCTPVEDLAGGGRVGAGGEERGEKPERFWFRELFGFGRRFSRNRMFSMHVIALVSYRAGFLF